MRPEALLLALLAAHAPVDRAWAGGLDGRTVLIRAETWDDPSAPYLQSRDYAGAVGAGVEFGVEWEGSLGLAVVPVDVDVSDGRIDLDYARALGEGRFTQAEFNGYVLSFPVECTLLLGAELDLAATTGSLRKAKVIVEPQALRIDLGGLPHGPGDRLGVLLDVADCPIS